MYIPYDKHTIVYYDRFSCGVVDWMFHQHEWNEPISFVVWFKGDIIAGTPTLAAAQAAVRLFQIE